jgi:hypothetical protein
MPSSTPSSTAATTEPDRAKITSRKVLGLPESLESGDDSLTSWSQRYLDLAVRGVRSAEVTAKIARHLQRFTAWIMNGLGTRRLKAIQCPLRHDHGGAGAVRTHLQALPVQTKSAVSAALAGQGMAANQANSTGRRARAVRRRGGLP